MGKNRISIINALIDLIDFVNLFSLSWNNLSNSELDQFKRLHLTNFRNHFFENYFVLFSLVGKSNGNLNTYIWQIVKTDPSLPLELAFHSEKTQI